MLYVGVDTGGTFTDVVVMDEAGRVTTNKAPTTHQALEQGVFAALEMVAAERGTSLEEFLGDVVSLGYGTTHATNALIERKGARTGLITTAGFGDTMFIQRLLGFTAGMPTERLGWYSRRRYPDPIVPRRLVREVPERIDQAGNVLVALDEEATARAVRDLVDEGVEAVAVSLLWSFRNDIHEREVGRIVREIAGDAISLSLSSDVNPVIGEYERSATTVLNSYLGPTVEKYLIRLEAALRERGFGGMFRVLTSIGGVMRARDAADRSVLLLSSGPTGGVIGSGYLAQALGHKNVISSDMGGTSFDVGMIIDGRALIAPVTEVAQYHVSVPMIDITAIGAGGGSIASVENGELRVGPESAGAEPGPVCYGRGGIYPTVTDADLVLGVIDPARFLGGRMELDRDAALAAIEEHVAEPLGLDPVDAAAGIRRIVDSQMADTLRELTIGRGHDPRDFVLYAYGGAGPMHCAGYGAELGVGSIVVPMTSMVQSAYGALAADINFAAERSHVLRAGGGDAPPWSGIEPGDVAGQFDGLEERCLAALAEAGVSEADSELSRSVDIRYRRQTHELIIPLPEGVIDESAIRTLIERFESTYEATYGRGAAFREAGIEITTFRVNAIGRTPKPLFADLDRNGSGPARSRPVYDGDRRAWVDALIRDWESLHPHESIEGPAVLEHPTTTIYVGRGQSASADAHGNVIIQQL